MRCDTIIANDNINRYASSLARTGYNTGAGGSRRRLRVRILHEEAPALKGLVAAFQKHNCDVATSDMEGGVPRIDDGDTPDLCIVGNLEACNTKLIKSLRAIWQATAFVLFDLSIYDHSDLMRQGKIHSALGLDGFLPAASSMSEIMDHIQRILSTNEVNGRQQIDGDMPILRS